MKKLVILALLVLTALVIACAKEELPPEPPKPGATGGGAFAGRAVFTGGQGEYAEDTADFFSISSDTPAYGEVLTATCQGDQFVYGSGYDTDVNGQWRQFDYEGERVGTSNWLRDSAVAERPVNTDNYVAGDNYILCYGCTKEAGVWNCHNTTPNAGGRWMAHQFNVHEAEAVQVCGNGVVEEPEQCDDNNLIDGDGCSAECMVEAPTTGCTSDTQCPEGQTCDTETGVCGVPAEGCTSDDDCAAGSVCNMEFHQCVEVAGSCTTDADCQTEGSNFFCNDDGQCEELPTGPTTPGETT